MKPAPALYYARDDASDRNSASFTREAADRRDVCCSVRKHCFAVYEHKVNSWTNRLIFRLTAIIQKLRFLHYAIFNALYCVSCIVFSSVMGLHRAMA